jgi:uncharacterized protein YndB with AHSA1/START domain
VIELVQTTVIPASPERVWQFFVDMDDNYQDFHPEHLVWRTLSGKPLTEGTIWFVDEWIGPMRVSSRFFTERAEPGRFFAYRVGFPGRLVGAGGSFRFTPSAEGHTQMREEVHFGFKIPVLSLVLDRILALLLPIEEFRRHIREEGENLVALFSQDAMPSGKKRSSAAETRQQ